MSFDRFSIFLTQIAVVLLAIAQVIHHATS